MIEDHSWVKYFRTTKFYLWFSVLQLLLTLALLTCAALSSPLVLAV